MRALDYDTPSYLPAAPPSFRPGLLLPKYPAGTVCGFLCDHPEAVEIIPEQEWDAYLKDEGEDDAPIEQFIHIKDQDGAGSCGTESTTQDLEWVEQLQGNEFVQLNPWFMYHTTSGGSDSGSSHDENLAFLRTYGCCPESVWPRSKGWRAKPSEEAYEAAKKHRIGEFYQVQSWVELGSALIARKPVIVGWPGHSILAVRIRKNRAKIKIANSWGDWGNQGYGDMNKADLAWQYGFYVIAAVTRMPE